MYKPNYSLSHHSQNWTQAHAIFDWSPPLIFQLTVFCMSKHKANIAKKRGCLEAQKYEHFVGIIKVRMSTVTSIIQKGKIFESTQTHHEAGRLPLLRDLERSEAGRWPRTWRSLWQSSSWRQISPMVCSGLKQVSVTFFTWFPSITKYDMSRDDQSSSMRNLKLY